MRPGESFVMQPVRSLQTMLRVIAEDDNSLPTVVPDGIYGPSTMQAVSAFQRKYSLPVTGAVNQVTWEEIVKIYEPAIIRVGKAEPIEIIINPGEVFEKNDSSPYIYLLQAMLTHLSNDHPAISLPSFSGVIDDATYLSIKNFQKLAGLNDTGELDRITWKHIVRHFTLNANRSKNEIN